MNAPRTNPPTPRSPARRPFSRRRALTLVEAVGAIVLVSVAVPPMLWALRDAQTARAAPVLAARARWLAAERLEDVLADRASPARGYAYVAAANYPPEASVAGFPGFSRSVSVTTTGVNFTPGGTGWKTVAVQVGWTDARGVPRSLSLSTVVAEHTQ